jgi:hypothetical protein
VSGLLLMYHSAPLTKIRVVLTKSNTLAFHAEEVCSVLHIDAAHNFIILDDNLPIECLVKGKDQYS